MCVCVSCLKTLLDKRTENDVLTVNPTRLSYRHFRKAQTHRKDTRFKPVDGANEFYHFQPGLSSLHRAQIARFSL